MSVDWTTVFTSGLVASVITSFQFLTTRYLARILDRIEKREKQEEQRKEK